MRSTMGKSRIKTSKILAIIVLGVGIPDDVLPKLFDPLFTTKQKGTGLGLVTCKKIVESHGGSITVRTKPTVFTVHLPKNIT